MRRSRRSRSTRCSHISARPTRTRRTTSASSACSRARRAGSRPGLALYGGVPRPELASEIRQVAHPQAAVLQLRDLSPGDSVGYNAIFTADRPLRAATVSLGYADGFLRCWSGLGALRYGEAVLPLLGLVSMDMVVVDCSAAPDLSEGDWLDLPYHLPTAAECCKLSQYELLTLLGRRFRRES